MIAGAQVRTPYLTTGRLVMDIHDQVRAPLLEHAVGQLYDEDRLEVERSLLRKLDRRMMAMLVLIYILNCQLLGS